MEPASGAKVVVVSESDFSILSNDSTFSYNILLITEKVAETQYFLVSVVSKAYFRNFSKSQVLAQWTRRCILLLYSYYTEAGCLRYSRGISFW